MNLHYKQHIVLKIDPIEVALLVFVYKIELQEFACVISFLRKIFEIYTYHRFSQIRVCKSLFYLVYLYFFILILIII